ncbi:Mannosyl-D-glycerate transport/metabolism system repressor MngR [Micromonospora sp. MW-13]|uniref:winged helix-turn-helix domain-containing protein n=1 Tax=Micromonospora sp. MW-13 TaxID=2094022 RepID=UPI000E42F0C4|nr:winged helix-turn-helix domain-containing protein [Micromonospora sp. MW-13]RGC68398.1 Mannosyl-D-glycerate transport/metabolism system repressor MngR [Micromonospora sp. MW-13]
MHRRKPLYEHVVDDITASIRVGTLKPGDKLPSIAQLVEQYGISHTMIKFALRILGERGLIETHQGKGSYVAERPQ